MFFSNILPTEYSIQTVVLASSTVFIVLHLHSWRTITAAFMLKAKCSPSRKHRLTEVAMKFCKIYHSSSI